MKQPTWKDTNLTEIQVRDLAKRVVLNPSAVSIWFDHLRTISENRRRGADKAETKRRKKSELQPPHESMEKAPTVVAIATVMNHMLSSQM